MNYLLHVGLSIVAMSLVAVFISATIETKARRRRNRKQRDTNTQHIYGLIQELKYIKTRIEVLENENK